MEFIGLQKARIQKLLKVNIWFQMAKIQISLQQTSQDQIYILHFNILYNFKPTQLIVYTQNTIDQIQLAQNKHIQIYNPYNLQFQFYLGNISYSYKVKNQSTLIINLTNMASKQPFKFFNITQKLTTWSIRINKFFKHRLLSKRKNVLLISQDTLSNLKNVKSIYSVDLNNNNLSIKSTNNLAIPQNISTVDFQKYLIQNLSKTWQINHIKAANLPELTKNNMQEQDKSIQKSKDNQNQEQEPSAFVLSKFNDKNSTSIIQKHFSSKKKYFDAIILLPENKIEDYPQIQDQAFATDFIHKFQQKIMKNIVAYRYANKFLNTSGAFIQSTSQYDFLKKSDDDKQNQKKKEQSQEKFISYSQKRPPSSKQLLDNCICYLGVVVGDRDYTDLNSWTLVSLSEQASLKNPKYVAKMYYDWADGQQLPMPGSFTLFKKKIFPNNKQLNYVQYL